MTTTEINEGFEIFTDVTIFISDEDKEKIAKEIAESGTFKIRVITKVTNETEVLSVKSYINFKETDTHHSTWCITPNDTSDDTQR